MPAPTEDLPPPRPDSGVRQGAEPTAESQDDPSDTEITGVHPQSKTRFDTDEQSSTDVSANASTETSAGTRDETGESRGPGFGKTRPIEDRPDDAESPTLETDPGRNPRLANLAAQPTREQRRPPREEPDPPKPAPAAEQPTPIHIPANMLPGEAEEKPTAKPYSLRPKQEDTGGSSASTGGTRQTAARRSRAQRLAWMTIGSLVGASAFAAVYLSDPGDAGYPFPPVPPPARSSGEEVRKLAGLPAEKEIRWSLQSGYFIGLGQGAIHVCDATERPAKYLGALALKEGAPPATIASVVSAPEVDGYRLAWHDGQAIRWGTMPWPQAEGKAPEFAEEFSGSLPLTGEEVPYAPAKLENWAEKRSEGFVAALRMRDGDALAAVDVARAASDRKTIEELGLKGRLIAPPAPFFDAEPPGRSLIFLATASGCALAECAEGKLKPVAGASLEFKPAFPAEAEATMARARFGAGTKGWIIASGGGYAAVAAGPREALRMVVAPRNIDRAAAKSAELATALAYPSGDDPGRDEAIIAWNNGQFVECKRIEFGGDGTPKETELGKVSSSEIAAWDINGDGRAELAALSRKNGEIEIYDPPRYDTNRAAANSGSERAGQGHAAWVGGGETLEAFWFSAEGEPVRIAIPLLGKMRDDLDSILRKDQRWRAGRLPF